MYHPTPMSTPVPLPHHPVSRPHKTRLSLPIMLMVVALTLFSQRALAELATEQQMETVCSNWLIQEVASRGVWAGSSAPTIAVSGDISQNGLLLARYYNLAPDGFVVVPILMEMTPVKMYSEHGSLDAGDTDGPIQLLRDLLEMRYADFASAYGDIATIQPIGNDEMFGPEHRDSWQVLAVSTKDFRPRQALSVENVGPLLTSSWFQGAPYNSFCPIGQGGRCVVGCVATATAQIMNYWQWPDAGFGAVGYQWPGDASCGGIPVPGQFLSVDLSDPYDWAAMRDSCDDGTGCNTAQQNALAELSYEVGVLLEMQYGACASGTSPTLGLTRFPYYFKYDWSIESISRKDYDLAGWFALIQQEIDAGRPTQYGIVSHSIVCDGWRTNGVTHEFHMNYGWGQSNNAWYVLDNLSCPWVSGGICPWDSESMMIGIQPETAPYMACLGLLLSETGGDGDARFDPGETVTLSPVVRNMGMDAINSRATIFSTDPFVSVVTAQAYFQSSLTRGQYDTADVALTVEIDAGCPDPYVAELTLEIQEDGGFTVSRRVKITVGDTPGFEDDMESGEADWLHRPVTERFPDQWHIDDYRSHSGSHSWKFGSTGPVGYTDGADGGLVTSTINLAPGSKLSFWNYMDAETAWDGGILMISENGVDWTKLYPVGGYPYNNTGTNSNVMFDASDGFFSGLRSWREETFDLAGFSGAVQLMFRFGADGGATEEGWYVDDVWVGNTPAGPDVTVSPFPGIFLTCGTVSQRGSTWSEFSDTNPALPSPYVASPAADSLIHTIQTTATTSGMMLITVQYDWSKVLTEESELKMMAYADGTWQDITMTVDTDLDQVTGFAFGLDLLVLAEPAGSCCIDRVGDANGSGEDEPTIGDISLMIEAKYISSYCDGLLNCLAEADINQSGGIDPICNDISIGDISLLIDYLFITGPETASLNNCL